jgi:hypothetical protein
MSQAKTSRTKSIKEKSGSKAPTKVPGVIVDFVCDEGLFFISVKNISDLPAYKVSVKFDHEIFGLGGAREVSALPLFRNIEFLAPQKEISTFLDSRESYFARQQPTKVKVRISYSDAEGDKHSVEIVHDLEIYRNLALAGRPESRVISDAVSDEGE